MRLKEKLLLIASKFTAFIASFTADLIASSKKLKYKNQPIWFTLFMIFKDLLDFFQSICSQEKIDNSSLTIKELKVALAHKLFPEDCVAELIALYRQLKAQNKPKWLIVITIIWNFLELFWAFYIQIKIENIWLPQRKIDD